MGKSIAFTNDELKEMNWILPMFKDTHEGHLDNKEAQIVDRLIQKFIFASPSDNSRKTQSAKLYCYKIGCNNQRRKDSIYCDEHKP